MDYKIYKVKVYANGNETWYFNDKHHRENGPAIDYVDGYKVWYFNDKRHREDGPAVVYPDGTKYYYINGKKLTEQEFISRTKPTADCAGRVVEIDGKKYTLEPVK
jgi:hypothetical protein